MKTRTGIEACLQSLIRRGQRGEEEPVRAGAARGHKAAPNARLQRFASLPPAKHKPHSSGPPLAINPPGQREGSLSPSIPFGTACVRVQRWGGCRSTCGCRSPAPVPCHSPAELSPSRPG